MKKINPVIILLGIAGILILGFVLFKVFFNKKPVVVTPKIGGMLNNQEGQIIPTVDSSVRVDFSISSDKKDAILKVTGIPSGTKKIDFQLNYEEKTKGLQGAIGSADINGEKSYEKRIKDALATCSSGKCVYHIIIGNIKATLEFSGSYGTKIFEKEYPIWGKDAIYLH